VLAAISCDHQLTQTRAFACVLAPLTVVVRTAPLTR
jgi:hypothetical protein